MMVGQDVEHSGIWRDLSRMTSAVECTSGPADILRGRGVEEYARWLAWLLRTVRDSTPVLPLLGLDSAQAVQLCAGVAAEAIPIDHWVLVRFPRRAFVAIRLLDSAEPPPILERAQATGLPVWRVRLGTPDSWQTLAARISALGPWLAQHRGWAAAGIAAHFAACVTQDLVLPAPPA